MPVEVGAVGAVLDRLPDVFRFTQGVELVGERRLRRLVAEGSVVAVARGLYRKSGWSGDVDLLEVVSRSPRATVCLGSALARHGLSDEIGAALDLAVPRGSWTPAIGFAVRWHHFDPATFALGREWEDLGGGARIGVYSAQRSIIDAFRLRHIEGPEQGNEALKRWLGQGGQPSQLLDLAAAFPRAAGPLRRALEILL